MQAGNHGDLDRSATRFPPAEAHGPADRLAKVRA